MEDNSKESPDVQSYQVVFGRSAHNVRSIAACASTSEVVPVLVPAPAAVVWHELDGCPTLSDRPYGLSAQGKPSARQHVDTATAYESRCDYKAAGVQPLLELHVSIDRGSNATVTEEKYAAEHAAAAQIGGADFAEVSQVGDAAFAWYDQSTWLILLKARSGNATVTLSLHAGRDLADKWSADAPLQQQLPVLTPLMKDAINGLR